MGDTGVPIGAGNLPEFLPGQLAPGLPALDPTRRVIITPYQRGFIAFPTVPPSAIAGQVGQFLPLDDALPNTAFKYAHLFDEAVPEDIGISSVIPWVPDTVPGNAAPPTPATESTFVYFRVPVIAPKAWVAWFPVDLPDGARITGCHLRYLYVRPESDSLTQRSGSAKLVRQRYDWSHSLGENIATIGLPDTGLQTALQPGQDVKNYPASAADLDPFRALVENRRFGYGIRLRLQNQDKGGKGVDGLGVYAMLVTYLPP